MKTPAILTQNLLRQLLPLGISGIRPRNCAVCGSRTYFKQQESGIDLHGTRCCSPSCFREAAERELARLLALRSKPAVPRINRLPLGLLLLSHGVISRTQLQAALESQRTAGTRKIGEWLRRLGYATELDITRALSVQCGCPMLSEHATRLLDENVIPVSILIACDILPVHYSSTERKLYVACCNEIDRFLLYQIEQMLDCSIVACIAVESVVRHELERVAGRRDDSIEFEMKQSCAEMARICSSYAMQLYATEMRVVRCGQFIWVRLKSGDRVNNLLFRIGDASGQQARG